MNTFTKQQENVIRSLAESYYDFMRPVIFGDDGISDENYEKIREKYVMDIINALENPNY